MRHNYETTVYKHKNTPKNAKKEGAAKAHIARGSLGALTLADAPAAALVSSVLCIWARPRALAAATQCLPAHVTTRLALSP